MCPEFCCQVNIDGGNGSDMASYTDSTSGVTVNLLTGVNKGGTAEGDTLINIEKISGSNYDDTLVGDAGGNYLYGNAGKDNLQGNAGNDYITGGAGADAIDGGDG